MSVSIKSKYIVGIILGLFLALFIAGWYVGARKERKARQEEITASKFKLAKKTIELNEMAVYLTQAEQALATEKELVKAGVIEREALRKLNIKYLNEISRLVLQIDTLMTDISHNGQIITIQQNTIDSLTHQTVSVKKNVILLPFEFVRADEFLSLKGAFDKDGKLDIGLKMDVPIDVITGISKETKKPFVNVTTPNSYIDVISIKSYSTDVSKPKRIGIGAQVGYGISLNKEPVLAPYIGLGISYNFIRL
jgi:hypothetical protein